MSYIIWLTIFIWLPTFVLWLKFWNILRKYTKVCILVMAGALIFSLPWDVYSVTNGIWYFPKGGHLGVYLGLLPIEEYLFITTVAFLTTTVTLILKYKSRERR